MDAYKQIEQFLRDDGAILSRNKNHEVWKLSNGKIFVRACTPSDHRAGMNQLSDLRKALGWSDPDRGKPGERRVKVLSSRSTTMREAFVAANIVESVEETLRRQISDLENDLEKSRHERLRFESECWCKHPKKWWKILIYLFRKWE